MKHRQHMTSMVSILLPGMLSSMLLFAAETKMGTGKDFVFPDYYPASNGVRRLKSVVAGKEAQPISNSIFALKFPKLTNYTIEGKVDWTASSPECTVNLNTREVSGNTNLVFETADERLRQTGVGFLWQQNSSVLIISNQSQTKIDKQALTNNAPTKQ